MEPEKEDLKPTPSSAYLLLNSADRIVPNGLNGSQVLTQPWNNFTLQRQAPIMESFAKRISAVEINFPMCIPNITTFNNVLTVISNTSGNTYTITVTPGFYTPGELVSFMNTALAASYTTASEANPPTISYSDANGYYTYTANGGNSFTLHFAAQTAARTAINYYTSASLFKTLGFVFNQSNVLITNLITGIPTQTQYTAYVDIVSQRIMRFTDVDDADSNNFKTKNSLVCRLYLADETSTLTQINNKNFPITCRPFNIHRQFVFPKQTKWDPDSFIDYIDLSVVDQYNNLVYMPSANVNGTNVATVNPYPDFQLTLLAAE